MVDDIFLPFLQAKPVLAHLHLFPIVSCVRQVYTHRQNQRSAFQQRLLGTDLRSLSPKEGYVGLLSAF